MIVSLILTRFYPATGGIINYVLYLAHYLSRRGIRIRIHADNLVFKGKERILIRPSKINIKYSNYSNTGDIEVIFERVFTVFAPLHMRLININSVREADVLNIHGHAELFTPSILYQLVKIGKPIVLTTHGALFSSSIRIGSSFAGLLKYKLFNNITFNLIHKYVNIIITPSEIEKKILIMRGFETERIVLIKNFIPDSYFKFRTMEPEKVLRKYGLEPYKYIITVARIDYNKSLHHVIQAIAILQRKGLKVRYVIVGPDEGALSYYLSVANKVGIRDNIIYLGAIYDKKILLSLIKYASAFVLSSYIEGQPLSILEAMSQSTPVIISDTANFLSRTVYNMFNGIVFKYGDIESLAQAILALVEDIYLRRKLGKNAFNYAYKNHKLSKVAEKYLKIFYLLSRY